MLWNDAVNACADLGNGWRLPTKYELNLMYLNKGKIGGFANLDYWSSTEFDSNRACFQYLGSDGSGYQGDHDKSDSQSVRAVRSF